MTTPRLTIDDLITKEIGPPVRPVINPLISSIGTTFGRLLANDPNRVGWVLVNLSGAAMFILHREDVSSTTGMRIPPNGGSVVFRWKDDFHWLAWEWFIVADAAASGFLVIALVTTG